MSGLEVWTPIVHEVTIDGAVVKIEPLKAGKFAAMQVAAKPVLARMNPERVEELVAEGHRDLVALLAIGTGMSAAWLDERDSDELLNLLGLVMETNSDFSRRRIAPAMGRLAETMNRALAPDGEASSPASAASDTLSPSPSI